MAIKPDKSKSANSSHGGGRTPDYSLDPVPVPDVVESDSDTAWGLWEHSLQAGEDHGKVPSGDGAYDETLPAPLSELAKINRRPPG